MLALVFTSTLVTALAASSTFTLTTTQRAQTYAQMHARRQPGTFSTASQAAYAAALAYGQRVLLQEIGAKIYVDETRSGPLFGFGRVIEGQVDPDTGDDEIAYDMGATDGHDAVVGLWHEHPFGENWSTLYGHDLDVRTTKQAIWTSIGNTFFVQFWDGHEVVPAWGDSEIPPLCSGCLG